MLGQLNYVVVEANEKSGALWTADFARKQNKPIYTVPHSIYTYEGKGSNRLLTQGALPYLGKESLSSLCLETFSRGISPSSQEQNPILKLLSQSPASIWSLCKTLNSSDSIIMDNLFSLELEGKVIIRGDKVSLL